MSRESDQQKQEQQQWMCDLMFLNLQKKILAQFSWQ